ncbi:hypothetical protein GO009_07815 [Muricauda sp. TY007]|uniref:hypothetical protein n=1 Tax=Allomuricauda sp. TY007 TaxID=2683200 RepID=UPI0013C17555|nr:MULTISPECIES: hypothetical protein [unclassified Allomuricauda]MBA4744708.1 hypothetical protein [Allomuricauda sp.]NDV15927.1 hypothetical protein [Muricauda sp. TY007]
MFKFFKNSSPKPSLHQLDHLYGQTICKCPLKEQISYCQRLIESSRYHLEQSCPKKDSDYFKNLIEAADKELQRLNSQRKS